MCKNGKTDVVFLTAVPGGTATDATYLLNLKHYTCGNRKVCANERIPITSDLNYQVLGTPYNVGNDTYCCNVLCYGTVVYVPYKCGNNNCSCTPCQVQDNIYTTICVPCSSTTIPTITKGNVIANPTDLINCTDITNVIGLNTTFNVSTTQATVNP